MMKNSPIQWKADYERDGYVVVENCLDPETLKKLQAGIHEITSNAENLTGHLKSWVQFERDFVKRNPDQNNLDVDAVGTAVRNIMELPLFDPMFADLICYRPLLDILQALFGSTEFAFHNYKCIIKAPRVGSKFIWHRDLPYLQHSTPNLITAMLCLDEMTEANGATVVLPGTHRVPHESVLPSDTNIPDDQLPASKRVTVCCPAGSAVLFHVNIIHGGGPNRSEFPRRNVISIWSGPDTYPVTAARYAYQDVKPRSTDPARIVQMQKTFPH